MSAPSTRLIARFHSPAQAILASRPLLHLSCTRLGAPQRTLSLVPPPLQSSSPYQDGRGPLSSTGGHSTAGVLVSAESVLRPSIPRPALPRSTPPHPPLPRAPGGHCTTAPGTCGTRTPRPPERTDRTGPGRGRCATRCRRCSKPSAGPPQQPAHPPHPLLLLPRSPV